MLCEPGDVQTILLRPEPHIQLFGADSDAHFSRAVRGHQTSDAQPSFRTHSRRPRRRHRRRVAAQRRLLAALASRLRHRDDGHRRRVLFQHAATRHAHLRFRQLLRPLHRAACVYDVRLRPNLHRSLALRRRRRSVAAAHQPTAAAASGLRSSATADCITRFQLPSISEQFDRVEVALLGRRRKVFASKSFAVACFIGGGGRDNDDGSESLGERVSPARCHGDLQATDAFVHEEQLTADHIR